MGSEIPFGIETFRNEVIDPDVTLSMKVVAGAARVRSWGEGVVWEQDLTAYGSYCEPGAGVRSVGLCFP